MTQEIMAGAKVLVTEKDGSKTEAMFVSAKAGWANVTVKGEARKVRTKDVELKMTKAEIKKLESAARKAEKDAAKAAAGEEGDTRLVPADLAHYVLHDETTASGRKRIDVDDEVAAKLRTLDLPATYKYAASVLDETAKALLTKYEHLNLGMQRMNLGNRIRKALRVGAEVVADVKAEKKPRVRTAKVEKTEPVAETAEA